MASRDRLVHTAYRLPMSDTDHSESQESDADFESDIHDFRELLRNDDKEGLVSALENPELYRMACDDERYIAPVMQGISALAWDEPAMASELLIRFDIQGDRSDRESHAGQAALALMAALEWRQLQNVGWPLSDKMGRLKSYLQHYPALHRDVKLRREMQVELLEHPEDYSLFCQELVARGHVLPVWVISLSENYSCLTEESAESTEDLSVFPLDESQQNALQEAISDMKIALGTRLKTYLVWALVIASMVVLPNAMGALIAIGILGASMALGEGRAYKAHVRPRLVGLALEYGVGSDHVLSRIYSHSKEVGRVGNFDIKIENDQGLLVLAGLGRSAMDFEAE